MNGEQQCSYALRMKGKYNMLGTRRALSASSSRGLLNQLPQRSRTANSKASEKTSWREHRDLIHSLSLRKSFFLSASR